MARATWALGAISVASIALSLWLYADNRSLRAELAGHPPGRAAAAAPVAAAAARTAERPAQPPRTIAPGLLPAAAPPQALPDTPTETRMDRRARRTEEFAAQFGRLDGETEDEYKARIMPMLSAGLIAPRLRAEEQRRVAQEKAHVTPEQSARLDKAFDKVYSDVIDFTNKAVADGQLSPYERNVSGWLDFAGGLGGILNDANGQIGKILSPQQVRTISQSGFEWGEYLGLNAPWENLRPPPPR